MVPTRPPQILLKIYAYVRIPVICKILVNWYTASRARVNRYPVMKPAAWTIWPNLIYSCASIRISTVLNFFILAQFLVLNIAVAFKLLRNCYPLCYSAWKCLVKFAMEDLGHTLTIFYKTKAVVALILSCYPTTWSSLCY